MPRNWIPNFRVVWPQHHYAAGRKRRQAVEPIVFQELLPLKLRNEVSGREEKTADTTCLQEMAVMFACLKANDFKEPLCSQEILGFEHCYKEHKKSREAMKKMEMEGTITPGAKTLTSRQLNILLKKYPNPE